MTAGEPEHLPGLLLKAALSRFRIWFPTRQLANIDDLSWVYVVYMKGKPVNSRNDLDDGYKLKLGRAVAPSIGCKEEIIVIWVEFKEPINYVK